MFITTLKDNEFVGLVNELRDIAIAYGSTRQLREQISHCLGRFENKWYSVMDCRPLNGREIEGRNSTGKTWEEIYDPDEPLGDMKFWKNLK